MDCDAVNHSHGLSKEAVQALGPLMNAQGSFVSCQGCEALHKTLCCGQFHMHLLATSSALARQVVQLSSEMAHPCK